MRHVAPLSPVASLDCAYFLSPRGSGVSYLGPQRSYLPTCNAQNMLPSPQVRSLPTGGTYLCPQTAHVAVRAFPNRLLSLSLEATSKDVSFPSRPRPCCSAATAPESSPHTSCPPSRKSSSAARSPRKRLRPGWWVRSGQTAPPTFTAWPSWTRRSIFGESISRTCRKPKGKPPKRCWSAAVVKRGGGAPRVRGPSRDEEETGGPAGRARAGHGARFGRRCGYRGAANCRGVRCQPCREGTRESAKACPHAGGLQGLRAPTGLA